MLKDPRGYENSIFTMYCAYYQDVYDVAELITDYGYTLEEALCEKGLEESDLQDEDYFYLASL